MILTAVNQLTVIYALIGLVGSSSHRLLKPFNVGCAVGPALSRVDLLSQLNADGKPSLTYHGHRWRGERRGYGMTARTVLRVRGLCVILSLITQAMYRVDHNTTTYPPAYSVDRFALLFFLCAA